MWRDKIIHGLIVDSTFSLTAVYGHHPLPEQYIIYLTPTMPRLSQCLPTIQLQVKNKYAWEC